MLLTIGTVASVNHGSVPTGNGDLIRSRHQWISIRSLPLSSGSVSSVKPPEYDSSSIDGDATSMNPMEKSPLPKPPDSRPSNLPKPPKPPDPATFKVWWKNETFSGDYSCAITSTGETIIMLACRKKPRDSWCWAWPIWKTSVLSLTQKGPCIENQQGIVAGVLKVAGTNLDPSLNPSCRWLDGLSFALTRVWKPTPRVSFRSYDLINLDDERLEGVDEKLGYSLVVLESLSSSGNFNSLAKITSKAVTRMESWNTSMKSKAKNFSSLVTRPRARVARSLGAEDDIRTISIKFESLQWGRALSLGSQVIKLHGINHVIFDQLQTMSGEGSKPTITEADAKAYVRSVKDKFKNDRKKFANFRAIMTNYEAERIDKASAIAKLTELMKGHRDLLLGLRDLIPGAEITIPPKAKELSMSDALSFLKNVEIRFQKVDKHVYPSVQRQLELYRKQKKPLKEMKEEILHLLYHHEDLTEQFLRFFPQH